jgi:hypothetical protein
MSCQCSLLSASKALLLVDLMEPATVAGVDVIVVVVRGAPSRGPRERARVWPEASTGRASVAWFRWLEASAVGGTSGATSARPGVRSSARRGRLGVAAASETGGITITSRGSARGEPIGRGTSQGGLEELSLMAEGTGQRETAKVLCKPLRTVESICSRPLGSIFYSFDWVRTKTRNNQTMYIILIWLVQIVFSKPMVDIHP